MSIMSNSSSRFDKQFPHPQTQSVGSWTLKLPVQAFTSLGKSQAFEMSTGERARTETLSVDPSNTCASTPDTASPPSASSDPMHKNEEVAWEQPLVRRQRSIHSLDDREDPARGRRDGGTRNNTSPGKRDRQTRSVVDGHQWRDCK